MQPSIQAGSVTGWGGTLGSTSPFGKLLPVTVGAGSNKTLIVVIQADAASGSWSVKFNDVAMTLLYAQAISSSVATSIWYMHNPPEGTFNAFAGVGSWYGQQCAIHCSVWNDVDQAAAFGTPVAQSWSGSTSPYVATITATADDVTLNSFVIYSSTAPTITPGAGQVQMNARLAAGSSRYGVTSYLLGATSSVSNSWTGGTSTQPAQVSVVLKGTSSGATDGTGSGLLYAIALSAPTATATGTGAGSSGTGSGAFATISLTAPAGSATGTTSGEGVIFTPVLQNNTETVLANETGVIVNVYNASTGALIVQKTGLTSNTSGIVTISDALIIPATTYAYEVVLTGGRRRLPVASAA